MQEKFAEKPLKVFFHKRTTEDFEGAVDESIVEKILSHEKKNGKMHFLVKWEGHEDPTWEPAGNFFQGFSAPLIEYGAKRAFG